jgi:metal-responsive CopG/Arc/MetJ family transcriptional regulator
MANTLTEERRSDSKRIQFEFSAEALERLDRMKKATGKSSYAELVRDALRVYEWFAQQEGEGYDIGLVKGDTLVKTVKFFL